MYTINEKGTNVQFISNEIVKSSIPSIIVVSVAQCFFGLYFSNMEILSTKFVGYPPGFEPTVFS